MVVELQSRSAANLHEQIADRTAVLGSYGISPGRDDRCDEWIVGLIGTVPLVDPLAMKPCVLRIDHDHVVLGRNGSASFESVALGQLQKSAGLPGDSTATLYFRPEGPAARLHMVHFDQTRLKDFAHVEWSPALPFPIRWWHDRRLGAR